MTCPDVADQLGPYLEGDLPHATRAAVDRHLAGCPSCAALVADLDRIAADAAALPTLRPDGDLWTGISDRIGAPVLTLDRARIASARGARRLPAWRVAAAAAAVVAVTAGVTHQLTLGAVRRQPAVAAGSAPPTALDSAAAAPRVAAAPQSDSGVRTAPDPSAPRTPRPAPGARSAGARLVAQPAGAALPGEAVYDQEIAGLRAVLDRRRGDLDPATVELLERNIQVIDAAIAQSRAALAADPRSAFLDHRLNRALDTKVQVLRAAAALPARS